MHWKGVTRTLHTFTGRHMQYAVRSTNIDTMTYVTHYIRGTYKVLWYILRNPYTYNVRTFPVRDVTHTGISKQKQKIRL